MNGIKKMKKKFLILQIDIGDGTQWGNKKTIDPIRDLFIPSVKNYSDEHGYDHIIITESRYEREFGEFDFLATKTKHYSFERYFHFNNDYEYTVNIDNDVYIYPNAQPLFDFSGLCNVREPEGNSSLLFREVNDLDSSFGYYNSGVTFCDNKTAKILSKYMINRMMNKDRAKGKNSDNMLLNEFIINNKHQFTELGSEWNYMPFLPNSIKIQKPNFFHFVGIMGKQIINSLQEKNINIKNFLNDIKNNN